MEVPLKTLHPPGQPTSRFLLQASLRKSGSCFNFHSIPSPHLGLVEMAKERHVTLVYSARDVEHNNAVALRQYLKNRHPAAKARKLKDKDQSP
jgi:hypothetical protein